MTSHAPYAIAGIVLAYAKTTKTACGKRVATARLVSRDATDCAACQVAVAADDAQSARLRAIAEDMLATTGCPHCGAPFFNVAAWSQHDTQTHRPRRV